MNSQWIRGWPRTRSYVTALRSCQPSCAPLHSFFLALQRFPAATFPILRRSTVVCGLVRFTSSRIYTLFRPWLALFANNSGECVIVEITRRFEMNRKSFSPLLFSSLLLSLANDTNHSVKLIEHFFFLMSGAYQWIVDIFIIHTCFLPLLIRVYSLITSISA